MLLKPDLGGRDQPVGNCQQPGVSTTMPALIDGNGFEAEIDGGQMGAGCGFYFQISIRGMSYASWVLALNWRRFSANDFSEALCQSDFTIEVRRRRARSRTSTG